jgi:anti-anti-sigma factor
MGRPWTADDHVCVSYQNDDQGKRLLALNLTAALERGEKFVYFAETGPAQDVLAWLRGQPLEVEPVLARGQLTVHPAHRLAEADGTLDSDRMVALVNHESEVAVRAGYTGVRICSEMAWTLRTRPSVGYLLEHERRLSGLLAGGELRWLRVVCLYDKRRIPAIQLSSLGEVHRIALTAEQAQQNRPLLRVVPLEDSAGLRLSGEIDRSNIAELSAALESALRDDEDLHLDLAGVRYADVAAVRLLVHTARRLRNGSRLVLLDPGPLVRAILRIYGWDQSPSLRIRETNR